MEQSFENGVYYTPGKKVLSYFSVNRILPIIVIFIVLGFVLDFLRGFLESKQITNIINASSSYLIIIGIICCVIAFVSAWIKYKSVEFMFDEFSFSIRKGFLSKSEITIPYKQIQYIKHSQSLNQKMLGIMNIIVETAGEDNSNSGINNNEGVLPILEKSIALSIEKELLRRSSENSANKR